MAPFRSRRSRHYGARPFIGFLLIASFGILFVGCGGSTPGEEEFAFTEGDLEQMSDGGAATSSGAMVGSGQVDLPYLLPLPSGSGAAQEVVLDLSQVPRYEAIRAGSVTDRNAYRITNAFVNVRSGPDSSSAFLQRLEGGTTVTVTAFPDASWAQVLLEDGRTGYIALRYLARITSDSRLAEEKKQFDGQYYVNYAYVNVRAAADQSSPKVGEIPGQRIVQPTSIQNGWAAVLFEGKTGYVSAAYLAPFLPSFQVRQDTFELPILHYRLDHDAEALLQQLPTHVRLLRERGYTFITLRSFADLLTQQESRDVRLNPKSAVIVVSGITSGNVKAVSDTLNAAGIDATLFLQTSQLDLSGITEKDLLTLKANGFDLESGGHTGDDFRALTNAQATLELQQSRKMLEERGQTTVLAVAYPQGGVNDRIAMLAGEAGYLLGVGEDASRTFTRKDLLRLPSIVLFPTMSAEEVITLATGQ